MNNENQAPNSASPVAYDDVPLLRFHLWVAMASTGGVFCDGYGLGIIGLALDRAAEPLHLTATWVGTIGAGSLAGLFVGALATGPVADRFGRRPIFAVNMLLLAIASSAQFFVQSGPQFFALRLLIGLLLGTDYVVSKALLTEIAPRRYRGRILSVLSVAWASGYASAYFVGFACRDLGPDAWRWVLLTSAVPCALIFPFRRSVPESPLWLVNHGQDPRAAAVVATHLGPAVQLPLRSLAQARGRWLDLFGPLLRRRTLVGCIFFTCQVIPYFALGTFVSRVISALHVRGAYVGGLLYNLSLLFGAVGGMVAVDRLPRRRFLVGSFVVAAAALLGLIVVPEPTPLMTVVLFAAFAGVVSAASNLVYVYLPELFPTALRASGVGLAVSASRLGSAAGTFLLPVIVADYGVRTALAACGAILVVGAVVCQLWAPETRNVPLDTRWS